VATVPDASGRRRYSGWKRLFSVAIFLAVVVATLVVVFLILTSGDEDGRIALGVRRLPMSHVTPGN